MGIASKNLFKLLRSLRQKKFRHEHKLFVAEGEKLVFELLNSAFQAKYVIGSSSWIETNNEKVDQFGVEVLTGSSAEMDRLTQLSSAPPVFGVFVIPENDPIKAIQQNELVLCLERINDPGNLGTIIRTADWFGCSQLFCSHDSVDVFNPKVVQATMGSLARVKVNYTDLQGMLKNYASLGFSVFGAVLDGESVYEKNLSKAGLLVMGSESHGISPEMRKVITDPISIPSFGGAESLNLAMASGILMNEFKRKF